jgi:hypothetical protein
MGWGNQKNAEKHLKEYVMLCHIILYYIILCYVMLCYVILYYIILYYISHHIILYHNIYHISYTIWPQFWPKHVEGIQCIYNVYKIISNVNMHLFGSLPHRNTILFITNFTRCNNVTSRCGWNLRTGRHAFCVLWVGSYETSRKNPFIFYTNAYFLPSSEHSVSFVNTNRSLLSMDIVATRSGIRNKTYKCIL